MSELKRKNEAEYLDLLPGIFEQNAWQEYDAEKKKTYFDPVSALLRVLEATIRGIERHVDDVDGPRYYDPNPNALSGFNETAREEQAFEQTDHEKNAWLQKENEWLQWLAFLVSVEEQLQWEVEENRRWKDGKLGPAATLRTPRNCDLIQGSAERQIQCAAERHKSRGSVDGLRTSLQDFYGVDAKVREWSWPLGMQIGVTSTIEVDTLLDAQPELDRSFVVELPLKEWKPDSSTGFKLIKLPLCVHRHLEGGGAGAPEMTHVSLPVGTSEKVQLDEQLEKIFRYVEDEKPAHTMCHVVFASESAPIREPQMRWLVIGVESTIGTFYIGGNDEHQL